MHDRADSVKRRESDTLPPLDVKMCATALHWFEQRRR
jgi:hypothetical protein